MLRLILLTAILWLSMASSPISKEGRPKIWIHFAETTAKIPVCNQPTEIIIVNSPFIGDAEEHHNLIERRQNISWHYTIDEVGAIQHLPHSTGAKWFNDLKDCRAIIVLRTENVTKEVENHTIAHIKAKLPHL